MRGTTILSAWFLLAAPAVADVLRVPGEYGTIQEAIDAAQPDDTIVVRGGTYLPIVVDKPLTILGDPGALIQYDETVGPPVPVVRLAGPGSGSVVLAGLWLSGGGTIQFHANGEPPIAGDGFDELQVHRCSAVAPGQFVNSEDCCFDGVPALRTFIPQVLVSHSYLEASDSDSGVCAPILPPPAPGIDAPGSTVTVLDSTVRGGGTTWICSLGSCFGPTELAQLVAPAVRSATLYFSTTSSVAGGTVKAAFMRASPSDPLVSCPTGSAAPPFGGALPYFLPDDLLVFGQLALGQLWTLYWNTPGPFQVLYITRHPLLPPQLTAYGPEFLDFSVTFLPRVLGPGPSAVSIRIPLNEVLIGLPITAQVFDTQSGYTRPVIDVVRAPMELQEEAPFPQSLIGN